MFDFFLHDRLSTGVYPFVILKNLRKRHLGLGFILFSETPRANPCFNLYGIVNIRSKI